MNLAAYGEQLAANLRCDACGGSGRHFHWPEMWRCSFCGGTGTP